LVESQKQLPFLIPLQILPKFGKRNALMMIARVRVKSFEDQLLTFFTKRVKVDIVIIP